MVSISREVLGEDPVQAQIGSTELTTNKEIRQQVEVIDNDIDNKRRLAEHLDDLSDRGRCKIPLIIVFVETKSKAEEIQSALRYDFIAAVAVNGDKN